MAKKISRRELMRRAKQRADSLAGRKKRDRAEARQLRELMVTEPEFLDDEPPFGPAV